MYERYFRKRPGAKRPGRKVGDSSRHGIGTDGQTRSFIVVSVKALPAGRSGPDPALTAAVAPRAPRRAALHVELLASCPCGRSTTPPPRPRGTEQARDRMLERLDALPPRRRRRRRGLPRRDARSSRQPPRSWPPPRTASRQQLPRIEPAQRRLADCDAAIRPQWHHPRIVDADDLCPA